MGIHADQSVVWVCRHFSIGQVVTKDVEVSVVKPAIASVAQMVLFMRFLRQWLSNGDGMGSSSREKINWGGGLEASAPMRVAGAGANRDRQQRRPNRLTLISEIVMRDVRGMMR